MDVKDGVGRRGAAGAAGMGVPVENEPPLRLPVRAVIVGAQQDPGFVQLFGQLLNRASRANTV